MTEHHCYFRMISDGCNGCAWSTGVLETAYLEFNENNTKCLKLLLESGKTSGYYSDTGYDTDGVQRNLSVEIVVKNKRKEVITLCENNIKSLIRSCDSSMEVIELSGGKLKILGFWGVNSDQDSEMDENIGCIDKITD